MGLGVVGGTSSIYIRVTRSGNASCITAGMRIKGHVPGPSCPFALGHRKPFPLPIYTPAGRGGEHLLLLPRREDAIIVDVASLKHAGEEGTPLLRQFQHLEREEREERW